MKLLPYGDTALLLDCDSLDEARRWFAALELGPAGYEDLVMGAQSVLVRAHPDSVQALRDSIATTHVKEELQAYADHVIEIGATYDGADLGEVAELTGLSRKAIVSAHTGTPWTVAFGGFAPGFAYLCGGDPRLNVPRRPSPRTRIPAGAIGLAGEFSGIYPRESPGGWQIIGHTDVAIWDLDREPPALLLPGRTVRFVESP